MDALGYIVNWFTYDFYERRDGVNTAPHDRDLRRTQFLPEFELAELQLQKLRQLLTYCRDHNSFYRRRFQSSGFSPEDLTDLAVLRELPLLTKDDIRDAGEDLFSAGFSRHNAVHKRTGGSTGIPLHVYWDPQAASFKRAGTRRHDSWSHLIPGVRRACVWGDTDRPQSFKEQLRNRLTERAFYLDTLLFDDEHINSFLDTIHRNRPQILMGHAHSLYQLAQYVRRRGVPVPPFQGIISTAMVLTPSERNEIVTVFQSPVFDRYGCEELGVIASECDSHQGLHLFAEGLYVELLGNDNGVPRELVVTDLTNRAMPMIRYRIGDCAVFTAGPCPCGRTLPRLREVVGRTADFLYRPNGSPVFGISFLDTYMIHIPGFKQVQIIQNRYDQLQFRIVKGPDFSAQSMEILRANIATVFGAAMHFDVAFVERIELTERGKYRFSICNIAEDQRPIT